MRLYGHGFGANDTRVVGHSVGEESSEQPIWTSSVIISTVSFALQKPAAAGVKIVSQIATKSQSHFIMT